MYYESRQQQIRNVADAMEAAKLIKEGKAAGYEALTHKVMVKGQEVNIYYVNDANINDSNFAETAVLIDCKHDKTMQEQIESITAAWIGTAEELAEYFNRAIMTDDVYYMGKVKLFDNANTSAWFTCGCCGSGFKSTIAKQEKFDQDATYGICNRCEQQYYAL
jgi:hypothetical protein